MRTIIDKIMAFVGEAHQAIVKPNSHAPASSERFGWTSELVIVPNPEEVGTVTLHIQPVQTKAQRKAGRNSDAKPREFLCTVRAISIGFNPDSVTMRVQKQGETSKPGFTASLASTSEYRFFDAGGMRSFRNRIHEELAFGHAECQIIAAPPE